MTPEEEIEYFRDAARNGPLGEWWKKVTEASGQRGDRQSE